jgi:hypothetical protein
MSGKFFAIQSKLNELVLDIQGGDANPGAAVVTWEFTGADNQLWWQDSICGVIRSKLDETLVLEIQDDCLVVNKYQPSEYNQKWRPTAETVSHIENDSLVLDIADMNEDAGARVCSYEFNGGNNQLWNFLYQKPENFYIHSKHERFRGKVVDVSLDDDGEEGSRAIMYKRKEEHDKDGNANQLFYEDKYGIIHTLLNNMVFDTSDEGRVRMFEYDPDASKRQYVYSNGRLVLKNDSNTCLQIKDADERKWTSHHKVEEGEYEAQSYQKWWLEYI